jgi:hypothetical protein
MAGLRGSRETDAAGAGARAPNGVLLRQSKHHQNKLRGI